MLIFADRHPQPQFDRHPGLAFADPFSVRLEDGEDLFAMGDTLAFQEAAADVIDLARAVGQIGVQWSQLDVGPMGLERELEAGQAGALQERFGEYQIVATGLRDLGLTGLPLGLVLSGRALELLDPPIRLVQAAQIVSALAPVTEGGLFAQVSTGLDRLAHGIGQQIEVGGKVYVSLHHEGVNAHREGVVQAFF